MRVEISPLRTPSQEAFATEVVERKGIGHPDTMCDALAESFSRALSRFYLERFGEILHHNVDKGLLWGGTARPRFGGGEVLEPIEVYLAGRATAAVADVRVPVEALAAEASRTWLGQHLRYLDPARHVRLHVLVRPTSADLASLFARRRGAPLANDTSFGVGFAPLDALERQVLAVERELNSPATKRAHPEVGEDIKVMGARTADGVRLTVACALVDRHVESLEDYEQKKAAIARLAASAARGAGARDAQVQVNPADGRTQESVYLTVTGTSAEAGDDGQVGRGNRANGLITPCRPMSLEATAGKNPVTHVGKLYNVLAERIARAAAAEAGVSEAHCLLLSRIGQPIDEPQAVDLKLRLDEPEALGALRARAEQIVGDALGAAASLWREIVEGRIGLW